MGLRNKVFQFGYIITHFLQLWKRSDLRVWLIRSWWGRCWRSMLRNGYFEVPVEDIEGVESFESYDCLYENAPYLIFLEQFFLLFVVYYFLIKVAVICELHDDARYDMLYHRFLPSRKTSLYAMMLLFLRLASILTSLSAFSIYFSVRLANLTFFSAYIFLSLFLSTLNTVEYAPSPD